MLKFLKSFGLGLLYMLLWPVLVAILALFALYGIYNFFVELIKGLIRFFKGKPFFPPFEEDIKAEAILNRGLESSSNEVATTPTVNTGTTNVYVQQNIYQNPPAGSLPNNQANNPFNNFNNPLPTIPSTQIPNIPGVDPAAIEAANQNMQSQAIEMNPKPHYEAPKIENREMKLEEEVEAISLDEGE